MVRGQRSRVQPTKIRDYVLYNASCTKETPLAHSCTPSTLSRNDSGKTPYPLDDYVTLNFSVSHQAFLAAVTADNHVGGKELEIFLIGARKNKLIFKLDVYVYYYNKFFLQINEGI